MNSSLTALSVSGMTSEMTEGDANPGAIVSEVDRSLVDDMLRVKSAFTDEKARWRRQASDMEHSIEAVQNDLSSKMQSLVTTVKNELATEVSKSMADLKEDIVSEIQSSIKTVKDELESGLSKMMKEQKEEIASKIQSSVKTVKNELASDVADVKEEMASVKDVENVIDTLDTLQSTIQDNPIKCTSPVILDKLNKIEKVLDDHTSPVYSSCEDLYRSGESVSGVYDIVIRANSTPVRVYCDMETDGGGWTVFQKRQDGSEDFFRGWDDYASGFGDVEGEFWLGNDYISEMTRQCCHELRIDVVELKGKAYYSKYDRFKVYSRGNDYELDVGEFSGTTGDPWKSRSGNRFTKFTTKDRDNDLWYGNCAQEIKGAGWYRHDCNHNLNGLYPNGEFSSGIKYPGSKDPRDTFISWGSWHKSIQLYKKTEMKFRKT